MMYCIFCLFSFQVLEKLDLEILKFWNISEFGYLGLDFIGVFPSYTISTYNGVF